MIAAGYNLIWLNIFYSVYALLKVDQSYRNDHRNKEIFGSVSCSVSLSVTLIFKRGLNK